MENNQNSFWQFSDQLRLQTSNLANLSLNDSIWSVNPYGTKKDRRNFDTSNPSSELKQKGTPLVNNNNPNVVDFKNGWNVEPGYGSGQSNLGIDLNGGFNKGIYSNPTNYHQYNNYNNFNVDVKGNNKNIGFKGEDGLVIAGGKGGRKNKDVKKENNGNKDNYGESKSSGVDKRFKTLPPSESLPRNETVGGYIFVCNNDTMEENLKRQLFGLPPRYRDSVRQITPGLPLFLYNYSTHQLHGIYEAASFGGSNIDPTAWEDKKNPGESRFPSQVRVHTRKLCEPLDEDAFRPILHHYDGPKFRLELSVPEALSLLDIFAEDHA